MGIVDFIDRIDHVTSAAELFVLLEQAAHHQGFHYISYAVFSPYDNSTTEQSNEEAQYSCRYLATNYPDSWFHCYFDHNKQQIDSVARDESRVTQPILWDSVSEECDPDSHQTLIRQWMTEAGIYEGVSIPVYGGDGLIYIISFASVQKHRNPELYLPSLHFLAVIFHDSYRKMAETFPVSGQ